MATKIQSLLSLEIQQFQKKSEKDQREILNFMKKQARQREKNIKKYGDEFYSSPAFDSYNRNKIKITAKSSKNQRAREFNNLVNLLESKTSTIKGIKQVYKDVATRLAKDEIATINKKKISKTKKQKQIKDAISKYQDLSVMQKNAFWNAYNAFQEENATMLFNIGSPKVQELMWEYVENTPEILTLDPKKEDDVVRMGELLETFTSQLYKGVL